MYEPTPAEVCAFCFTHMYRQVGWDLARVMAQPEEIGDDLYCPDRDYPPKLWGSSVFHAFASLLKSVAIKPDDIGELARWQLDEPEVPPIRLLAPESLEVFKRIYPPEGERVGELISLQRRPPAFQADPHAPRGAEVLEFVEHNASLLWSTQQSFAILFYNYLLHHDLFSVDDVPDVAA